VVQLLPDAVRRDPIFRLVGTGRGRWLFIALVAATTAVLLVGPELWLGTERQATAMQLGGRAAWALVGVPVVLYLYFWVPISISTLLRELAANGVLVDPDGGDGTVADSAIEIDGLMDSPFWPMAGVLAVVGSFAWEIFRVSLSASPTILVATVLAVAGAAVTIYAGIVMLLRLVAGTIATGRAIGRAESRVVPLHGDDAGGWGGFGQRFFVVARAGIAYGAVAIVINLAAIASGVDPTQSPASMITLAYFVLLPPLVVWTWFFAPHRAMLDARARALAPLTVAAGEAVYAGLAAAEGDDAAAAVRAGSERLDELVRRRDLIVATHPAWPLRLVELRAIWVTAFAPVIAAVVATVANIVSGWLVPD
jgi:hypothetical protein